MAGSHDGDAGSKVEELVAVHVFDAGAAAALGHQRIAARVGRRDVLMIEVEDSLGFRARQRSDQAGQLIHYGRLRHR